MTLRFGQTLFGAAVGVVTAAGLLLCTASAQGAATITRLGVPQPVVAAASGQVLSRKTTPGQPGALTALAQALGDSRVDFLGQGLAATQAVILVQPKAEFYGAGESLAYARDYSTPLRIARARPLVAQTFAVGTAEGSTYQLGRADTARGLAIGYGTTYHLGYGTISCTAQLQGMPAVRLGASGVSTADAVLEGTGHFQIGTAGHGVGVSTALADVAITVNGVRHVHASGEASVVAQAECLGIAVFQGVTAKCSASAQARAVYFIGAQGHGQGSALAWSDPIAAATAVTAEDGVTSALAEAWSKVWFNGKGSAVVRALGQDAAQVKTTKAFGQAAISTSSALGNALVKKTRAYPDDAYGVASGKATMNRRVRGAGHTVEVFAVVGAAPRKIQRGHGVVWAQAFGEELSVVTRLGHGKAQAKALGTDGGVMFISLPMAAGAGAEIQGTNIKTVEANPVEGLATAAGFGANQVNDLVPAPGSRTLVVLKQDRTTPVEAQNRTLFV